jgi:hypothetical protein
VKVHESVRSCASVTWHRTGVAPTAKLDAVGGLHLIDVGAVPPVVVGSGYETNATGAPAVDVTDIGAGQLIFGACVTGTGVGSTGLVDEAQPAIRRET